MAIPNLSFENTNNQSFVSVQIPATTSLTYEMPVYIGTELKQLWICNPLNVNVPEGIQVKSGNNNYILVNEFQKKNNKFSIVAENVRCMMKLPIGTPCGSIPF